jgi:hypothetical protein
MSLPFQKVAYALPINFASTTNGATATGNIDRLGYDYVSVAVLLPTSDAVSNNPSTLKISESDDTVVTNFADVTAFVGDTAFTIPNCVTAASQVTAPFAVLNVDCKNRKRYLKVSVTPLTTQVIVAHATLSRGKTSPDTTTEANALVLVNG